MSRWYRSLMECVCIVGAVLCSVSAHSQTVSALPDAPQAHSDMLAPDSGQSADPTSSSTASLSGTVLDTNGDVIQGAHLSLSKADTPRILREVESGSMGQFEFNNLDPGTYVVTVSGNGMTNFVSKPISLRDHEAVIVPSVVLSVAEATTSVMVMDRESASAEQVEIAEQQRVLKVFPNFYSSFDWNAPPMMAKQKYRLALRTLVDPVSFLTTGAIAGVEQQQNIFPSFGGGIEGYMKRYGAAYAGRASSELLTRAILPSMFHTDPRYFVMAEGSTKERAMHAITSTFLTRGDDGRRRVNFPEILGGLSAAAISNVYYPAQERGSHLVLINGFSIVGGNMMDNLIREFVINRVTTRARR